MPRSNQSERRSYPVPNFVKKPEVPNGKISVNGVDQLRKVGDKLEIREHTRDGINLCSGKIGIIIQLGMLSDKDVIQCLKCDSLEPMIQE